MIEWERYLPEVMPSVSGCPQPIAITAIRNAAIELCMSAPVWREDIDPIYPVSGLAEYDIDTPDGSQAVVGELGQYQGSDFYPVPESEVAAISNITSDAGTPTHYNLSNPETVKLFPTPNDDAPTTGITLKLRLAPTRDAYEAPDWLYNQYADIIAYGAKKRLQEMNGRPWFDRVASMDNDRLFQGAIAGIRGKISRGHTNASQRVRQREFI